ncbi:hypothetical protein ACJX0J_012747, partial [Zea mays]
MSLVLFVEFSLISVLSTEGIPRKERVLHRPNKFHVISVTIYMYIIYIDKFKVGQVKFTHQHKMTNIREQSYSKQPRIYQLIDLHTKHKMISILKRQLATKALTMHYHHIIQQE